MDQSTDLNQLALADLRSERIRCRRSLELARLRSRQDGVPSAGELDDLRARADALTEELIRRYAADLSLVDSLLEAAYPHDVGSASAPAEGGAVR
jgi:hypothetical protein